MKSLLAFLSLSLFLAATGAHATSKFAGDYYALSLYNVSATDPGILSGGVNLTVNHDGTLTGYGAYFTLYTVTSTYLTGKIENNGKVVIHEQLSGIASYDYVGHVSANGKKFVIEFSNGTALRGRKISARLPAAGVYDVSKDNGDEAMFSVYRDGTVYGLFYKGGGDRLTKEVEGRATNTELHAKTSDGLAFDGAFITNEDGLYGIDGTYSDGMAVSGSFSGWKY